MSRVLRWLLVGAVLLGTAGVTHAAQDATPAPAPQKSWEDMGVDDAIPDHAPKKKEPGARDDGKPAKGTDKAKGKDVDPAHAAEGEPGGRVPWSTAAQAGAITALTIITWGVVALPLGLIPFAGLLAQFAGLSMPFLSSALGWAFLQKFKNGRAPLRVVMISGAIQCGVDLCCLLPLIITPLAPLVCVSRCFVDACVNGIATTILLRQFGRMKVPGEAELNWDMLETPPPMTAQAQQDPGYGSPGRPGNKPATPDNFLAPAPAPAPQPGQAPRAPSPDADEGTTIK